MRNEHSELIYPSSVNLRDQSAQSIQIAEMSDAFRRIHGMKFTYVGISDSEFDKCSGSNLFVADRKGKIRRSIFVVIKIILSRGGGYSVFTREIFFAAVFLFLGKKVVWECHQATSPVVKFLLTIMNFFSRFRVLCISKSLRDSDEIPVSSEKKYVYHDGVSLNFIDQVKKVRVKPFKGVQKRAVYTGALHKGKDIESLEPLFKSFIDWNFEIVGGRPGEVARYRKMYKEYGNVVFFGRKTREEVLVCQCEADVLLYPLTKTNKLWRYTSPLKLFEYMAAGKPIVGSNIGSVSELLNDKNAFVFNDNVSILSAFERFLSADRATLNEMVKMNEGRLLEKYNWDVRASFIFNNVVES